MRTGLGEGTTYKVQMRARYNQGIYVNAPWSGPWSNVVSLQAPAARDNSYPPPDVPDEPEAEPDGSVPGLNAVCERAGRLYIYWDEADPEPDDYRVMWVEADHSRSEWETYGGSYIRDSERSTTGDQRLGLELDSSIVETGKSYNVRVRARYSDGGVDELPWSGPWAEAGPVEVNNYGKDVQVSFGVGGSTATEGGAGANLVITLDSEPGRNVIIPISVAHHGGGGGRLRRLLGRPGNNILRTGGRLRCNHSWRHGRHR